jgi:hypothetical protein
MPFSEYLYNSFMEEEEFIDHLMAEYLLINRSYGKYSIRILTKMLQENKLKISTLLNHNIIGIIKDLLDYEYYNE